ncbi:uncharacterized protein JCM15063_003557 [Sporobolomyces koalae]|uniref:uncharacterized protein n=1 Tax=Sporobolomyces koalae TaxID=500713 RepID=UPI0031747872
MSVVVSAAPSKQDMIEYLGGKATGQTLTTVPYTLTVLANETDVLVSCEIDHKMSEVGWIGFGVGSTMSDADIVILWPNSDSTWTLSHRRATTTALPLLLGKAISPPQRDSTGLLSIVTSLSSSSSSDSPTIVTFSRPLNPDDEGYTTAEKFVLERKINQGVIFAVGDDNPGSDKQDSDLKQHSLDSMGGAYIDLSVEFTADTQAIDAPITPVKGDSAPISSGGSGSGGTSTTTSGGVSGAATYSVTSSKSSGAGATDTAKSRESTAAGASSPSGTVPSSTNATGNFTYATVIKIHAACAALAWLFLAPVGVLYARLGRGPPGTTFFQFPWHFAQQTWVTTPLTLFAVGLAYYATTLKASSTLSGSSAHRTLGFTLAVMLVVQVFLGWWTHESHGRGPQPRALKAWLHIILGHLEASD